MVKNTTDENYVILNGYKMYMSPMVGYYYQPYIYSAKLKVNTHQQTIVNFLQDIGARPTFISSILSMVGIDDLSEGLQIITGEDFKELVLEFLEHNFGTDNKPLKFTPHNLSSILKGSGIRAPQAIRSLSSKKAIEGIKELIELGFTTHNLAHILHSSGIEASEIVEKLIANKDILRVLLIEKAPAEISSSSALHSIGKPEKVMPALEEIRDTAIDALIESIRKEKPGNIIADAQDNKGNSQNQAQSSKPVAR